MNIADIIKEIDAMELDEKVNAINELKRELKKISPFAVEPVDCVQWVKEELVIANDYNPNSVAPPEMELLHTSIQEDGYTHSLLLYISMMESMKNVPSYRRLCKCMLRNDYWCKGLSFTQQKSTAYEKYCKMMKERREAEGCDL